MTGPRKTRSGWRARVRCGGGQNPVFELAAIDEADAIQLYERMVAVSRELVRIERPDAALLVVRKLGLQADEKARADVERFAAELVRESGKPASASAVTFRQLAEQWVSGELARRYPDQVRVKRSVRDDRGRLAALYPVIGDMPLRDFTLEHAEQAMASLPVTARTSASRRQYGQLISRLLKLAVYPCKLIERSPLPVGFLPRGSSRVALSWLYPSEEAALLRCTAIPLERRVFYGLLAREGLRAGEAAALTWRDVDLQRGAIRLDVTKTDEARAWALDSGVAEALRQWRGEAAASERVFPDVTVDGAAERFRAHLAMAGVDRPELFERSATRRPIRVHDLRATFITLALANGRSETWVADRTGHKSSQMINRYRRAARTAAELELGTLQSLAEALPDLQPTDRVNIDMNTESGSEPDSPVILSGSTGTRTRDLRIKRAGVAAQEHAGGIKQAAAEAPENLKERERSPSDGDLNADSGPEVATSGHVDPVEQALADALSKAATAGRFDVVSQLATELETRRRAREATTVIDLGQARRERNGGRS